MTSFRWPAVGARCRRAGQPVFDSLRPVMQAIAEAAAASPPAAVDVLVVRHMPLAKHVGRDFWRKFPQFGELADYQQTAMLGLVRAAQSFDPAKGYAFSTWAWRLCRQQCINAIATARGRARHGRRVGRLPINAEGETMDVADARATTPLDRVLRTDEIEILNRGLAMLDEGDRDILERRFAGEQWAQIGRSYGTSAQAVHASAKRTLSRLARLARVATASRP